MLQLRLPLYHGRGGLIGHQEMDLISSLSLSFFLSFFLSLSRHSLVPPFLSLSL
jgi:hypothetical protein